jgi:hypothetical protein
MAFLALLLAAAPAGASALPACRPDQLRLSAENADGRFDGMSHSGTELSIRNVGRACTLPALPPVVMLNARGRLLPAVSEPSPDRSRGRAMRPVRLAGGHRATIDLRWVSGAVFERNRSVTAAIVAVRIGRGLIRARLGATLYGPAGGPVGFDQSPAQAAEGIPAH